MNKFAITISLAFLIFLSSCKYEKQENKGKKQPTKITEIKEKEPHPLEETFIDSIHIGTKGLNKVEIRKRMNSDSIWVAIVKFYTKKKNKWFLQNEFIYEQMAIHYLIPYIKDFNNDGYNDFIYTKGTGSRGGNALNKLFIYKPHEDHLIYIKNSLRFPNINYDKDRREIRSYILTGYQETVFLKVREDSLQRIASISQGPDLTVKTFIPSEKTIRYDSICPYEEFTVFTGYNPVTIDNSKQ